MATDTWTSGSSGSWTTAGSWSGGVPTSSSDVVIGSSANNTTITSSSNATVNTIMINSGDQLDITNGSTFTDTNASAAGGTFGVVDLNAATFVIGNGVYDNSGDFTFDSMTANQSILAISGSVSFDGAGAILLSAIGQANAGSNIITSRNNIATLTDVDNNLSGTGSILGINFINETTVETGNGTLILWGDVAGGAFNNENLLKADTEGTLIFGNGADNTVNITNVGTIDINNTIADTTTKVEITDNVIINNSGGGRIEFTGSNGGEGNEIVSDGTHTAVSLTLNGGELTGAGSIGDSFLSLKLQSFLIEETQVQLVLAAATTNVDASSKIEAAEGGEIFIDGPVTNSGIVNVLAGGEIFVTGSITNQGNGAIYIGPGGTLSVLNTGSIIGIVQFTGSGGVLAVAADHRISNSIAGAARGDGFDLTYEAFDPGFQAVWAQGGTAGTLFLEKNGVVQTTVSLQGQYTSSDFEVERDTNGNTLIEVIGNPSPPSGTTADMIMRDGSGNYEIYDLGNNAILAAYSMGQVGPEWKVAGLGGFFGSDTSDMILRNSNTGQFEIYDISNNSITNAAPMGQVGLEWQVAGFGDFSSRSGETDMLMRNSNTGQFEIYDLANNGITSAAPMGQVGLEWSVAGFGDFSTRASESDMLMRNNNTGQFEIYDISNNQITSAAPMGQVGLEWSVAGFGDFSGNANETDMLMRNKNTGAFEIYDIRNSQLVSAAPMGQVGLEWQVAGFGAINGAGASDMLMRNSNTGAFEIYDIANNGITSAASMGQVGLEWSVGGIAADPPSGASNSQLVQAMASMVDPAGGALDTTASLGSGPPQSSSATLFAGQIPHASST